MLALNVVAADTDPEARRLFTTQQQAFVAAHRPDELQLTANVFDHAARVRSFALASEAFAS